jgi:pimeloyl-ACP methyl ester carboxylesterase
MLMWRVGIADRTSTSDAELDAWLDLLRRDDGGRACVRMATGLERTRAKSEAYGEAIRRLTVPVQVLWGVADPVLKVPGQPSRAASSRPHRRTSAREPQGVSGGTKDLLDGSLLNRLHAHIRSSGGSYSAH